MSDTTATACNRQAETRTQNGAYITRDWNNDGFIEIHNAKTLDTYEKLAYRTDPKIEDYGVFFAFSNDQFNEGYARLVKDGYINEGDKVTRGHYGMFGVFSEMLRYIDWYNDKDKQIAEQCDPQEVYWYEWRNHECNIDWDGDRPALERVIHIFGIERARKIKRVRALYEIDEIIKEG